MTFVQLSTQSNPVGPHIYWIYLEYIVYTLWYIISYEYIMMYHVILTADLYTIIPQPNPVGDYTAHLINLKLPWTRHIPRNDVNILGHISICCGPIMWYNDMCSPNKPLDWESRLFCHHNIAIVQRFGLIFMQPQGFTNVHSGKINHKQEQGCIFFPKIDFY